MNQKNIFKIKYTQNSFKKTSMQKKVNKKKKIIDEQYQLKHKFKDYFTKRQKKSINKRKIKNSKIACLHCRTVHVNSFCFLKNQCS
jgi:hypothetical protein